MSTSLTWLGKKSHKNGHLAGSVAVVTGASGGIGRAISLALARQEVQVCVVGRDPIALEETVAAVRQFSQATHFQMDLTVTENFQPLLQHLQREAGGLDILIHCARCGSSQPDGACAY